jgi:hypothetical protein
MTRSAASGQGAGEGGALLTIAWYAVVLAVVFTTAFWIGRLVGPEPAGTDPAPLAPHAPAGGHS